MIVVIAQSLKNKVIVTIQGNGPFRVDRLKQGSKKWQVWTENEFSADELAEPKEAQNEIIDHHVEDGVYTYRAVEFDKTALDDESYYYSNWVRCGNSEPIGWSFGNYEPPIGQWGEICTPDDIRYTWVFGVDFRANNGQIFYDNQIKYFVDMAVAEIERRLGITIKKVRARAKPQERGLVKGQDYDVEESPYEFKYAKIARFGKIITRKKPIIQLHRLNILTRFEGVRSLLNKVVIDKNKGVIKLLERPLRPTETIRGIQEATNMYGTETLNMYLFYELDYDAGYETAADVPLDIRMAISKCAAIGILNAVGDGLMAGFSSSSLSMDGMSESFSSTQSATSAYFGARIQQYIKELDGFIEEVKRKYAALPMGSL
ncbi:MAG: hypothetical protein LBB72_01510 [Spirochaetaceae bacterium]|jgi:hypothetical protein|nr:hypothetical protein [Spirochaetaceae bacterium]